MNLSILLQVFRTKTASRALLWEDFFPVTQNTGHICGASRAVRTMSFERSFSLSQSLSPKQLLFCTYFVQTRNGREAAAKCGYRFAQRTAARLLRRSDIRAQISELDRAMQQTQNDIAAGYARLAFGCVSDAVKLALHPDDEAVPLEEMDLFAVSEIKCGKNGVEIKFFDRLKALEKLEALTHSRESDNAKELFSAIGRGAAALQEGQV